MRAERMDQIPEMCVMTRLIRSQCVQTWVRRNTVESSCGVKHIKVNPVPARERSNVQFSALIRQEKAAMRYPDKVQCLTSDRLGALVAYSSSWGVAGRLP